jgi:hypothetical protein
VCAPLESHTQFQILILQWFRGVLYVLSADAETEAEVFAVLERFRKAVSERDLQGVLQLFAQDSDVFISGSDQRMKKG